MITQSLVERFWEKVSKGWPSGCWLWTAALSTNGYGRIGRGTRAEGTVRAHRLSWEIHNGPIPVGLGVLHYCDTPSCVNPGHLFLGDQAANLGDAARKGRMSRSHQRRSNNAKLTLEQAQAIVSDDRLQRVIARDHDVSQSAISLIKTGRTWVDSEVS